MAETAPTFDRDIPPLIVALDFVQPDQTYKFIDKFTELPNDLLARVGLKIPSWHGGNINLRHRYHDSGLFTVLDTRLHDGVDEMAKGLEYMLSISGASGKLLLPNAVTMSPAKETVKGQRENVKTKIFDVAHQAGVRVFSGIDEARLAPSDDLLHDMELDDAFNEDKLGFDAFQMHMHTVFSTQYREITARAQAEDRMPTILASRFSGDLDDQDPQTMERRVVNRVARASRLGASTFYIGTSILESPSISDHVRVLLEAIDDAHDMDPDEFARVYPNLEPETYTY